MTTLTPEQIERYRRNGYLMVRHAVTGLALAAAQVQLADWIEQCRAHSGNWGTCADGKARFDLAEGHSADRPLLRRVSNPAEISPVCKNVLFDSAIPDIVADLIGPSIKFHHCKVNL